MTYLTNIREIFESFDTKGCGVVSTKKVSSFIDKLNSDKKMKIGTQDFIEFADPTFYGNVTFNFFVQAMSQTRMNYYGKRVSILKYVNEISD